MHCLYEERESVGSSEFGIKFLPSQRSDARKAFRKIVKVLVQKGTHSTPQREKEEKELWGVF